MQAQVLNSRTAGRPEDEVAETLKQDILFGRLRPRERLVEGELVTRFGVNRHVVRAALDHLDRAGLVRRRANRGVVVTDYETEEVEELYEMREILQRAAAERIPLPASPALISTLRTINDGYGLCLDRGDLVGVGEANDKFHSYLFEACGNRFLAQSIEEYWLKTAAIHCYAIGVPHLARQSLGEHAAMIDALQEGDRPKLVRLCIEHMYPALDAYKIAHGGWTIGHAAAPLGASNDE